MKTNHDEDPIQIAELFAILLNWDLNLAFDHSSKGPLYTVTDDDTEVLTRVTRAELEEWVNQRQAREICGSLLAQSPLDGLLARSEDDPMLKLRNQVATIEETLAALRTELNDLRREVASLSSEDARESIVDGQ